MRLRSLRIEKSPELMIIPMIDIIFFLLVFFMLSSLSMIEQRSMPVSLPKASQSQADNSPAMDITVLKDGTIQLSGSTLTQEALSAKITAAVQADSNIRVVLRGDKAADYGKVVSVLDEVKAAGAKYISIAAEPKK